MGAATTPAAAARGRDAPSRSPEVSNPVRSEAGDTDGTRWPRGKRHDDKALAVIEFDHPRH